MGLAVGERTLVGRLVGLGVVGGIGGVVKSSHVGRFISWFIGAFVGSRVGMGVVGIGGVGSGVLPVEMGGKSNREVLGFFVLNW